MLAIWQWGRYRVTAMFTTLPWNLSKSYCPNTKRYIIFIYPHVDCLKSTNLNAATSQFAFKQHMHTTLQLYTLLYFK